MLAVVGGGRVTDAGTGAEVWVGLVVCVLGSVVAVLLFVLVPAVLVLDELAAVVAVPADFTVVAVGFTVVFVVVFVPVEVLVFVVFPAGPFGLPAESSVYFVLRHSPGCWGAVPIVAAR